MKQLFYLTIFFIGLNLNCVSQVTLHTESFETNGEGTRYNSNTYYEASPNCNFFMRAQASPLETCFQGTTFTGFQGSFFWGGEDIMRSGTPLPPGSIITQNINVSGYNTLQVSLYLATANDNGTRWETADSINIKASLDGGVTYSTVGRFMGNGAFGGALVIDANLNGVVDGDETTVVSIPTFTKYTFPISGTGSNLKIWLDFDQIGGSEEIGVDLIQVTGIAAPCTNPSLPTLSASPSVICNGNSTTLSVTSGSLNSATAWKWYTGSCGGTLAGTGNSISVSPTSTTIYYVRGEGACVIPGACSSVTVTVNSIPSTPGSISGTTTICSGTTNTYSVVSVGGASSYNWTLPGGWTGTSATNSISATSNSTSGSISVTATNACGTSSASSQAITVNSIPSTPGSISGTTTICSGTTNTYSITPVVGASSYNWTLPGGWTGTSATNSISATANSTSGAISVTATNTCGTSSASSQAITVNSIPSTPGSISGTTAVCSGTTNTYSVAPVAGASSYSWSIPIGWSGTGISNSISVTSNVTSGSISVAALNTCGISANSNFNVSVNPLYNQNISASICSGSTYTLGTQTLSAAGNYTETFTSISGCDSIVNLTLVVNPVYNQNISASICSGSTYTLGTQTLSAAGNYTEIFTSISGCDSIVNLTLIVNPVYNQNISASICSGSTYTLGTQTLSAAGNYTEIFTSISGCDSVVTLALSVNPVYNQNISASICSGSTYTLGTQTLSAAGNYTEIFTSISGCDSVVTLALSVNPVYNQNISASICSGSTYTLGTQTLSAAGNYTETFTNALGCDSIVNLTLSINSINTGITISGNVLTSEAIGVIYQWIDCNNGNASIPGETGASFTASTNGSYAVVLDSSGCKDTSVCVVVNGIGTNDFDAVKNVSIYPNPNNGNFTIVTSAGENYFITNMMGQLVKFEESKDNSGNVMIKGLTPGVYLLIGKTYKTRIVVNAD